MEWQPTEIFWLKSWFAVAMIGFIWSGVDIWREEVHDYLLSRMTKALFAALAGFIAFGFVFAFLFMIAYGLIWFFTA